MMREIDEAKILETNTYVIQENEITFSSHQNYCVCMVDIINSTEIIIGMGNPLKVRKYILTFINSMVTIARRFGASIIKTLEDSVIFYFAKTSDCFAMRSALTSSQSFCRPQVLLLQAPLPGHRNFGILVVQF